MELISHSLTPRLILWHSEFDRVRYHYVWRLLVQCSTSIIHNPEASPKAISRRTSYYPARLEFHHEPQFIRGRFNERRFGPPQGFTPASSWSWLDRRVSGLHHHTSALLRLAFATAPFLQLNLAWYHNSPAHSSIGTTSGIDALCLIVGIRFQRLFTPLSGYFSPFPHGTCSLSVTEEYLALRDGPRIFRQDFTCPALLWYLTMSINLRLQDFHLLWLTFPSYSSW